VPSCAEGGVLGILPGLIGVVQATEIVKILLGIGETLSGRLMLYDALGMSFRTLKLRKNPSCVICGPNPTVTELIDYAQFCGVPSAAEGARPTDEASDDEGFARQGVAEIKARLDAGWSPFVLDVRKPHEADIVRFDWADTLIPHEDVGARLSEIPRDRPILVHCKAGGRSAKAAKVLADAGYEDVTNMEGGITGWASELDPSMPTY
jgi:adenylyltransferase/sulfurtransferase